MLTGSVNKILDSVGAPGRHREAPPECFYDFEQKIYKLKDEMILKMKTKYNS